MEQKFIDRDGLKVLWNQISLKDYPNNETLMAVIDAIDETKANKDEIVQADWNQTDENKLDYIKNKPFGEEYGNIYYLEEQTVNIEEQDDFYRDWIYIPLNDLVYINNKYIVVFDGVEYEATLYEEEDGAFIGINYYYPSDNRDNLPFGLWFNEFESKDGEWGCSQLAAVCATDDSLIGEHTVAIYAEGFGIKKIDKKYLPAELSNISENMQSLKDDIYNLNDNLLYQTERLDESISNKMDKVNPVGSGSLSFNRKAGSADVIGDYATILGNGNEEQWRSGFVTGEFNKEYIKYKDVYDEYINARALYQKNVNYYRSSEFSFDENTGIYTLINPILISANEVNSSSEGDYFTADQYEHLTPETISGTVLVGVLKNYEYNGNTYTTSFSNHNTNNFKMVGIHRHKSSELKDSSVRGKYVHTVGNGTLEAHSNAHTLDWDGNAWFSGDVYVGSTSGTNKDEGSKKLASEEYVDSQIPTDDDALALSIEMGLIEPIENNGYVLTDANGVIYTI